MERKLKHLDLIQGIINRMAHCSFLLKGWSVILLSGIFAIAAKENNPLFVYLAFLPSISFWVLDGYYLFQERLYRHLYSEVRQLQPDLIDFGMNTLKYRGRDKATWCWSIFSKTMLLFHGILILIITSVTIACGAT